VVGVTIVDPAKNGAWIVTFIVSIFRQRAFKNKSRKAQPASPYEHSHPADDDPPRICAAEPPSSRPAVKRILLVDDHPSSRGMMALLSEQKDFTICGEAENAPAPSPHARGEAGLALVTSPCPARTASNSSR